MPETTDESLESWIWDAAWSIRGAKDEQLGARKGERTALSASWGESSVRADKAVRAPVPQTP